jgi:hypothetical protein
MIDEKLCWCPGLGLFAFLEFVFSRVWRVNQQYQVLSPLTAFNQDSTSSHIIVRFLHGSHRVVVSLRVSATKILRESNARD